MGVGNVFVRENDLHGFWGLGTCQGKKSDKWGWKRDQYHHKICHRIIEAKSIIFVYSGGDRGDRIIATCQSMYRTTSIRLVVVSDADVKYQGNVILPNCSSVDAC